MSTVLYTTSFCTLTGGNSMSMQKTEEFRNFLLEYLDVAASQNIVSRNALIEHSFHFVFDTVGESFSWELFHAALVVYANTLGGQVVPKEIASSHMAYSAFLKNDSMNMMVMADLFPLPTGKKQGLHVVLIFYSR